MGAQTVQGRAGDGASWEPGGRRQQEGVSSTELRRSQGPRPAQEADTPAARRQGNWPIWGPRETAGVVLARLSSDQVTEGEVAELVGRRRGGRCSNHQQVVSHVQRETLFRTAEENTWEQT